MAEEAIEAEEVEEVKTPRELKQEARLRGERDRKEKTEKKKHAYQAIQHEAAFVDLCKTIKDFADYHTKMAKDAVGWKDATGKDGKTTQVLVNLTNEERLAHLDKAVGQEEILAMIDRQLA